MSHRKRINRHPSLKENKAHAKSEKETSSPKEKSQTKEDEQVLAPEATVYYEKP